MKDGLDLILGAARSSPRAWFAWVSAVSLHTALVVLAAIAVSTRGVLKIEPEEVTLDLPPPEPPVPDAPPPEPEVPAPTPPTPERSERPPTDLPEAKPAAQRPGAPPAEAAPPAAAGAVLAAPDDAPLDLTDSMVVGTAETYAGGTTSSQGTSSRRGGGGAPDSTGTASGPVANPPPTPAVAGPDRSRSARLADGVTWSCPFPREADEVGRDSAVVRLSIQVDATGGVQAVTVSADPGVGFGRAAASCARTKRFRPALDASGAPVASRATVDVRFSR